MASEYEKARDQLSEILNRDEFTDQQWFDDWRARLSNMVESLGNIVAQQLHSWLGIEVDTRLGSVLPVILGVTFLILLWWLSRRLFWSQEIRGSGEKNSKDTVFSPAVWWEKAENHAKEGEYQEGIAMIFQAVLEGLVQKEILIGSRFKSNRDYREEVERNRPELASLFQQLTRRFDRVRYGNGTTSKEEYMDFYQLSQELLEDGGAG
ncbi:protein of unknown function [Marininema mesophilum]|uniref:Protein-glutamine gamma-glutamyltransferase-like C-terminal domain-containing protein n=1 Tax=Marininema mesophilum TaxID=1048340 RepID=A0A1H2ZIF1_9BACL|nr:DUF4129 domain-containing protein [Marininema mesophilum]SDX17200.1 protein of unknown function [Marininema mesophilum]